MIRYRDMRAYKYELLETYDLQTGIKPSSLDIHTEYIDLSTDGHLVVRAGYAWDGPSGPAVDTKNFMRGSLVHDSLYQLIRMGLLNKDLRGDIDATLRKCCLEDGMSWLRAAWVFTAVRSFGWMATTPRDTDNEIVKEAP